MTPPETNPDLSQLLTEMTWLRALARQLVGPADQAEDLFQDTLVSALHSSEQVRGRQRPWLRSVASHLAGKNSRRTAIRRRHETAAVDPKQTSSALDTVDRLETQQRIVTAVQALDEKYRTVLLLRFWDDLPPREIAVRLDLSVETVKTRLRRGIERLRQTLDKEYGNRSLWLAALQPLCLGNGIGTVSAGAGLGALGLAVAAASMLWFLLASDTTEIKPPMGSPRLSFEPLASDVPAPGELAPKSRIARRALPTTEQALGETLIVRVIDSASSTPVRGAKIFALPTPLSEEYSVPMTPDTWMASAYDAIRTPSGRTWTSDKRGEASLPMAAYAGIVAVCPGYDGLALCDTPGVDVIDLHLRPRVGIPIEVVDTDGRALTGVPVSWAVTEFATNEHGTLTDALGRGLIQIPFASHRQLSQVWVRLAVALAEPLQQRVDLSALPTAPIRFVLPATGILEVSVTTAAGQPANQGVVQLRVDGSEQAGVLATLQGGIARFDRVSLGHRVHASATLPGYAAPLRGEVDMPRWSGGIKRLELTPDPTAAWVVFRIVDEDLLPMPFIGFSLTGARDGARAYTDGDAQLHLDLTESPTHNSQTLTVAKVAAPNTRAYLALPKEPVPGTMRLPDLVLGGSARVASGRVTDGTGASLPDIQVRAQGGLWGKTDADGRFILRGTTDSPRLLVSTENDLGLTNDQAEVAVGQTHVELVLHRPGSLRISIDPESATLARNIDIHLKALTHGKSVTRIGCNYREGGLDVKGLVPGRYQCRLELHQRTLHELSIEIIAGQVAQPTLDRQLDFRNLLTTVTMTVLDQSGQPIYEAQVADPAGKTLLTDRQGRTEIIVPTKGGVVVVEADGYQFQLLKNVSQSRQVVLSSARGRD